MSRVQLALNVNDLHESIAFYSKLFGVEPAKVRAAAERLANILGQDADIGAFGANHAQPQRGAFERRVFAGRNDVADHAGKLH